MAHAIHTQPRAFTVPCDNCPGLVYWDWSISSHVHQGGAVACDPEFPHDGSATPGLRGCYLCPGATEDSRPLRAVMDRKVTPGPDPTEYLVLDCGHPYMDD